MLAELETAVRLAADGAKPLRILDAGCGASTRVQLGPDVEVVGLDISPEALARNAALDERVLGDVQTHTWPPESFDLIVCWDVLEHLDRPEAALDRFASAVRDGGTIALGLPNLFSFKALATKLTPYRFHAWAYRRLLGSTLTPFPTRMRSALAPPRLRRWARSRGFRIAAWDVYEGEVQRRFLGRHRAVSLAWHGLAAPVRLVSAGRIDPRLSELAVILQREPTELRS